MVGHPDDSDRQSQPAARPRFRKCGDAGDCGVNRQLTHLLTGDSSPHILPIGYTTRWLFKRSARHLECNLRGPRRSDAARHPRPPGLRRSNRERTRGTVRHDAAGDIKAPQSAGACRPDFQGSRRPTPAKPARAQAAGGGQCVARPISPILGGVVLLASIPYWKSYNRRKQGATNLLAESCRRRHNAVLPRKLQNHYTHRPRDRNRARFRCAASRWCSMRSPNRN